jgi:hypothetical protein
MWLNSSTPDCCPVVPGSNSASPQPTANCQSPGRLPPRMALGYGLTSLRATEEKITKMNVGSPKTYKDKKIERYILCFCAMAYRLS